MDPSLSVLRDEGGEQTMNHPDYKAADGDCEEWGDTQQTVSGGDLGRQSKV